MDHEGRLQFDNDQWVDAVCHLTDDQSLFLVGGTEVLRLERYWGEANFEEASPNVFKVLGPDDPVYFRPRNRSEFTDELRGNWHST